MTASIAMLCDYPAPDFRYGTRQQPTPTLNLVEELASWNEDVAIHVLTTAIDRAEFVTHELARNILLHIVPVPPRSGASKFYLPRVARLRRLTRSLGTALVHAQGAENAFALTAVHSGARSIVTPHGIMNEVHRVIRPRRLSLERVPAAVERHVIPRADALVAVSQFARISHSPRAKGQWFDIPNPVRSSFYSTDIREPDDASIYVHVGSIYPLKGLHVVIQAARLLDAQGVRGRVIVAGDAFNPRQRVYLQQCMKLCEGLTNFMVDFRGWLLQDELLELYRRAKALIVASSAENAPMVVAEALAAGCPVISTPVGAVAEWVQHSRNGFLYPVDDADALAKAVARVEGLVSHISIRRQCRRSADRFRPDRVAKATTAMYERLLEDRRDC